MNKFVTIIEDDNDLLTSLMMLFEESGYGVKGYHSASAFFKDEMRPSKCMFLIDWNLPGEPGIEIVKSIRETDKISPIFMMSANNRDEQVIQALKLGADQYMRKPFDSDELLARINNAYFKIEQLQENLLNIGIKLLPEASTVIKDGIPLPLTTREYIIFQSLYQKKDLITREELIKQFDPEMKMGPRNIDVHIFSLRKKVANMKLAIETVWGAGYRLHILP